MVVDACVFVCAVVAVCVWLLLLFAYGVVDVVVCVWLLLPCLVVFVVVGVIDCACCC